MKTESSNREVAILATAVHSGLVTLHLLGACYHLLHRRWGHVSVHVAGAVYSGISVAKHLRTESTLLTRARNAGGI